MTNPLAGTMSERALQDAIIEYAHLHSWLCAHFRPALTAKGWRTPVQGDGKGYPDLVLARHGKVVFAELKSKRGKLSEEQVRWHAHLPVVYVWTPQDWLSGAIEKVLE